MALTIILLALVCILNVVDYVQTIYAIQLFGVAIEINPVARFLFENNCEWVKLVIVPALLVIMGLIIKIEKRHIWAAWVLLLMYVIVVMNNFIALMSTGVI